MANSRTFPPLGCLRPSWGVLGKIFRHLLRTKHLDGVPVGVVDERLPIQNRWKKVRQEVASVHTLPQSSLGCRLQCITLNVIFFFKLSNRESLAKRPFI